MVLREITFRNILPFGDGRMVFEYGRHSHTDPDHRSFASQAIHFVFTWPLSDYFRQVHPKESSYIGLTYENDGHRWIIKKEWKDAEVLVHTVSCEEQDRHYDLKVPDNRLSWMRNFLQAFDKLHGANGVHESEEQWIADYDFITSLMFSPSVLRGIMAGDWWKRLFRIEGFPLMENRIGAAMDAVSGRLVEAKRARQAAESILISVRRLENDLKQCDAEINRAESQIASLQESCDGLETEAMQAGKIQDFITEKKNEIEKLGFEIRGYRSVLQHEAASEFSDEEIREIQEKSKMYEQILKREEAAAQRLIERNHLEKNLRTILNEVRNRKPDGSDPEFDESSARMDAFGAEIIRIKEALSAYQGVEQEQEALRKEKDLHRPSFDKFHAMQRMKQILSRTEQKQLMSAIDKLEEQRKSLADELEQMQPSILEDRYRILTDQLRQKRQQIAEQKRRLEELYMRRIKILHDHRLIPADMYDLAAIESRMRHQFQIKNYLILASGASSLVQTELMENRKENFRREMLEWIETAGEMFPAGLYADIDRSLEEAILRGEPAVLSGDRWDELVRLICLRFRTHYRLYLEHGVPFGDSEALSNILGRLEFKHAETVLKD